jgi:hypothetical protein
MKKTRYILSIFLITFLISTAYGFPGMVNSNSTLPADNNSQQGPIIDLANTSQSDQDIVLVQHLIELDAVSFQSEKKLSVRETLIFRNLGTKNFSGNLRTWVPDGSSEISVGRSEMMTGGGLMLLPIDRKGNIISWMPGGPNDTIEQNSRLPFLYVVEYKVDQKPEGTLSYTETYSKMLAYPTLINYRYDQKEGLPAIIIIVKRPEGSSISFQDENGNKISPSDVTEDGNSIINRFNSPEFKEINVEISRSAIAPSGSLAVYVILGIIIVLVLSYPLLRKKSEKIQAFEEKIRNSLKREDKSKGQEEEIVEETREIPAEEIWEDEELTGKTKDELLDEKNEITSKLDMLNKDYASGNLMDEEYEDLKKSYQGKIKKLDSMIEKLG